MPIDEFVDQLSETTPAEKPPISTDSSWAAEEDTTQETAEAKPSLAKRLRVILGLSVVLWALILWAVGVI